MKQKAARNKTIDFTLEEGHVYLERCILAYSFVLEIEWSGFCGCR